MKKIVKSINLILGLISIAFLVFNFFVLSKLQPSMVAFNPISLAEEGLLNWIGVGLLFLGGFLLLSLLRLIQHLRKAKKISFVWLIVLTAGVLSLLFVFSDLALLGDIAKQYKHNLSQPEWMLVYPIMAFQLIVALLFTFLHLFGFKSKDQVKLVVRDNNILLIVQYVGLMCGLMGLTASGLGFLFPKAWNLDLHVAISSIVLLMPYVLVVSYWFITKIREEKAQWYDEKQFQDLGKSAFLTLILSGIFMISLFIVNYNNLEGIISNIWLPLYLFFTLFTFSLGNLYFSGKS